ncbi:Protein DVU_0535 [Candidatus Zixiibacteriota bacterium]|nr:Protein DVU_0535 [candidate division Zixibacteria bacterium]
MSLNRRNFIKLAAAGTLTLTAGEAIASDKKTKIDTDNAFGVLVDTVVCIGCRKCEWACNDANTLSNKPLSAFEDKSIFKEHRRPNFAAYTVINQYSRPDNPEQKFSMKVQCMHCNDPACASACIVGAFRKTPQGPVTYDAWKCMGCRYCMIACPFQIPAYEFNNVLTPQVRKCTFCSEKLKKGEKPACVGICPNEALTFGTRKELIEMGHTRIAANPEKYFDHVYGEHEIGGTSWMYLASADFINTELPKLGDRPVPEVTETTQHGIFKNFIPPLALYGLLGLAMYNLRDKNNKEGAEEHE